MLKIENLSVIRDSRLLFQNFSYELEQGKVLGILAPSGSGKTTLLDIISGTIDINPKTLIEGKVSLPPEAKISRVFQEPRLIPHISVLKNIMLPVEKLFDKATISQKTFDYLKELDLMDKASKKASEISGGEQQRTALVRALLYPSKLILLDEAFQSQDEKRKLMAIEFTKKVIKEENRSAIVVSHVKAELDALCDNIITQDSFVADN